MGAGVAFPAAVVVRALLGAAAAAFLVGSASASWHAEVFKVGGEKGWEKPAAPDNESYSHWAASNHFHVGDFLHFKYDKNDSVLVVTRDDYKFCGAARPAQRFDGGDTRFCLDHNGFFYFISGAPGHCQAGQRMMLRVLAQGRQEGGSDPAPPAEAPDAMTPGGEDEGGSYEPSPGSGGSKPGHGGSGSGLGSGSTSTLPPRGVAGGGGNETSGAAPARAPSSFGGYYRHVVGAVVLDAMLLFLGA
ncbi:hypothetical protein C2845_PM10G10950 [Panicum miliaceum]|uniref:Phytocyanin domain-containing protein n=1 Tax=Panicum miliaceum TaxID=4540 RepID=A0A3L6PAM3_PANMI|nr:hypothetical protein C2845_PM10G10950 [Panicum miliaceum]